MKYHKMQLNRIGCKIEFQYLDIIHYQTRLYYLWKEHVASTSVDSESCSSSLTGCTRDSGAQCRNSLKAVSIALVYAAKGGWSNRLNGGIKPFGSSFWK